MTKQREARFRILIVDDHPLMRRGFSDAISEEPTLMVCGEASTAGEALDQLKTLERPPPLDDCRPGASRHGRS